MNPKGDWRERIGLQTIIWGEDFPDGLDHMLGQVREMGYRGVEFFQIPSRLGPAAELEALLEKHHLALLGLSGGSLEERVVYCRDLARKPKFLYLQKWEHPAAEHALAEGHTLALHPHQYSPVDTYHRALEELRKAPPDRARAMVLPDSAHLYLSDEDLGRILEEDGSQFRYLHLKDWTPEFGTSLFSYAGGFCELGAGIVPLEAMWARIQRWLRQDAENWVIIEQDSSQRPPRTSCQISMRWLEGVRSPRSELRTLAVNEFHYPQPKPSRQLPPDSPAAARVLIDLQARVSLDSARDVDRLYQTVLEELASLVDLKCATVWEISPRDETTLLRAFWQPPTASRKWPEVRQFRLDSALSGLAVAAQVVRCFEDVRQPRGKRRFSDEAFINAFDLKGMISIPVPNRWNPNQPELLLNLFPQTLAQVAQGEQLLPRLAAVIAVLRPSLAIAVERAWDQKRAEITHELDWISAQSQTSRALLAAALDPLQRHLHCRHVKVYLLHPSGIRLEQAAPWPDKPIPVEKGDTLVGQVWDKKRTFNSGSLTADLTQVRGTHLLMPIYRQGRPLGEVMGVVYCQDKLPSRNFPLTDFTITDEMVLDAAQTTLVPHLDRMLSAEARSVTMSRINHELKEPLTIFRHATTAAQKEMKTQGWRFSKDHIGKARRYLELMEQIAAKSGFLKPELGLKLDRKRVLLFEDIIQPAIEDLSVYLEDRGFAAEAINVDRITKLPALFVDKVRFQQVAFNILTNAIKYAEPDPAAFRVEIHADSAPGGSLLVFEDWGTGIDGGMEETIFLEGKRGPNAIELNVMGDGIGLFMVYEILKAHGATIRVTHRRKPTRFGIFLPRDLTDAPWQAQSPG